MIKLLIAIVSVAIPASLFAAPTESVAIDTKTKQVKNPLVWFTSGNTLNVTGATLIGFPTGVTAFTSLTDVPNSYTGSGGMFVRVNVAENGLEFVTAAAGGVTSWNTRAGDVVPASGDYTAAQVTNAVDSTSSYADPSWITSLVWSKITGAPAFITGNQTITLSGDASGSGTTAIAVTNTKVNGVSYGTSPSTNTVPVVTGANATTYEAVPNAALANSSVTLSGHSLSLGGTLSLAIVDLSDAGSLATWAGLTPSANFQTLVPHTFAQMRSDLGGTTAGQAFFTLTNPSAITFPRINADNSVDALSASAFRTAIGAGTGGGDALTTNPLSQFASTTSSQFKGVISDENAPDGASSKVIMALGSLSVASGKTGTFSNTLTLAGTDGSTLNIGGGGTLGTAAYTAASAYEVPLTFSTGLTRSTNTVTVNTSQNITKLSNLTNNGFVTTTSGDGTLVIDTSSYQPLDSDLTAIAALTTDAFGRALLTKTDGASVRSYIGAGTGNGTVTNTGGNLTSNAVVLGAGTSDTKVSTEITTDGLAKISLGSNGGHIGALKFFGSVSGDVTFNAQAAQGTGTAITLPNSTTTIPISLQQLTFNGPTNPRTITLPDANFTAARTDAANTFTGHQTIEGVTSTGATGTGKFVFDTSPALVTPALGVPASGDFSTGTFTWPTFNQNTSGSAATLTTTRNLWGQSFNGSADVTGSLTSVGDITGGASNMTITAGTGNSRTMTLRSTTSGGTATAFLTGNADQSSTFGGNISGTGAWTMTGGAGNMTIVSGTGNSRTMTLQTTTSGGTATTAATISATQVVDFANAPTAATVAIPTISSTSTLTNKRITKRVDDQNAPSSPYTINTDSFDGATFRGINAAFTLNAPSGTPTSLQPLLIRFKDDGTGRALTWTTGANGFRAVVVAFPTTTVANKTTYVLCVANVTDSRWDSLATGTEP